METIKSARQLMLRAYELGQRIWPDRASRFSRQDFTQPQLFACLVVREALKHSYRRAEGSYFQMLWTAMTSQAAFRSPSTYTMPSSRSCSFSLPFNFRQLDCAFSASLNAIANPAVREPEPLVR